MLLLRESLCLTVLLLEIYSIVWRPVGGREGVEQWCNLKFHHCTYVLVGLGLGAIPFTNVYIPLPPNPLPACIFNQRP